MHETDKWTLADFPRYAAEKIRAPMISWCSLNVECRLVSTYPSGSHTAFIGEAIWEKYEPNSEPLIYHDGKYFRLGTQLPKE